MAPINLDPDLGTVFLAGPQICLVTMHAWQSLGCVRPSPASPWTCLITMDLPEDLGSWLNLTPPMGCPAVLVWERWGRASVVHLRLAQTMTPAHLAWVFWDWTPSCHSRCSVTHVLPLVSWFPVPLGNSQSSLLSDDCRLNLWHKIKSLYSMSHSSLTIILLAMIHLLLDKLHFSVFKCSKWYCFLYCKVICTYISSKISFVLLQSLGVLDRGDQDSVWDWGLLQRTFSELMWIAF